MFMVDNSKFLFNIHSSLENANLLEPHEHYFLSNLPLANLMMMYVIVKTSSSFSSLDTSFGATTPQLLTACWSSSKISTKTTIIKNAASFVFGANSLSSILTTLITTYLHTLEQHLLNPNLS